MTKYLLPCECGKGIVIDASQAGQRIECSCGALLEVPTLRGVRELEPVQAATSGSRPTADWDSTRGMIFAGSLLLFVMGAAVVFFGYSGLQATPNITREAEVKLFDKVIDEMTLDEVYEAWKGIREHGLGEQGQNAYVNIRNFRTGRLRIIATGMVLCVVGLLGSLGALWGGRARAS
jgi:hypothetical protein